MSEYKNQLNQPIGFPVEDWQRRPYPPRTSIIGKYCQVEPIDIDAHAEELYQAYGVDKDKSNWT